MPKLKEPELKFISEDALPVKMKRRSLEWLKLLKKIPEGQAMVTSPKELGVSGSSIKIMVARLRRTGQLSSNYYVTQRTMGDKTTIYIVHSAKGTEKA